MHSGGYKFMAFVTVWGEVGKKNYYRGGGETV